MLSLNDYKISSIINYLRRSRQDIEKEKRTGEDTLSEQKKLMDRVLTDLGIPYDQKLEIGSGDKIATRPIFQGILEDLKMGKYDAIAVKEISRLGRGSYSDMGVIYDLLQEKRIYIITPWKIYDPNNPTDARQIRFELFLSREEFEMIRERMVGAKYNYAMQGKWVAGTVPYGYKYNKHTQKLEPNEEQAKIIKMIYDFYLNGYEGREYGLRAICTFLQRTGVPSAKNGIWTATQVKRCLTNPVYIGQAHYRRTFRKDGKEIWRPENEHIIVPNAHEPIIDELTFYSVQKKLKSKSRKPSVKENCLPCELAGLIVCNKCGRRLQRCHSNSKRKNKNGTTSNYFREAMWCMTAGCTYVRYRLVEEAVLDFLNEIKEMYTLNPNELKSNLEKLFNNEQNEVINKEDIIKTINEKRKSLKQRLEFVYEKYETGIYSDEEFLERKTKIEKELELLNNIPVNNEDEKKKDIKPFQIDNLVKNVNHIIALYNELTEPHEKNQLLRSFFDFIEIEIVEKGRGNIPSRFAIYPNIKQDVLNVILQD